MVTVTSITLLYLHKQISKPLRSFQDYDDLHVLFGSQVIEDLKQHVTIGTPGIGQTENLAFSYTSRAPAVR